MRSLRIVAAVAVTAILLSGCPDKKPEPVPGPQSELRLQARTDAGQNNTGPTGCPGCRHGVSRIS